MLGICGQAGARPKKMWFFLFCAKLTAVKAPELLLRAFASLGEGKSVLVFVGSGPLEEELRTMAYDLGVRRIHFGGFVNQSRLAAYYKAADVLVFDRHDLGDSS